MKVTALAPAMGAEITNVDLSAAHDGGLIAELRSVWPDRTQFGNQSAVMRRAQINICYLGAHCRR